MKPESIKEIEEIAPTLAKMDSTSVHKVPYNYFDNLSDDIWNKIQSSNVIEPPKRTIFGSIRAYFDTLSYANLAFSGSLSIVLIVSCIWMYKNQHQQASSMLTELASTELNHYIDENIEEFPEELIAKRIDFNTNKALLLENNQDTNEIDNITNEALENLEDENI